MTSVAQSMFHRKAADHELAVQWAELCVFLKGCLEKRRPTPAFHRTGYAAGERHHVRPQGDDTGGESGSSEV